VCARWHGRRQLTPAQAFVAAITNCARILPIQYLIGAQVLVFLPLAMIRNLARLSTTALVADVFIIAGLIYIYGSETQIMAQRGPAHVELFNPKDWSLMIGCVRRTRGWRKR
jgi:proton-coupled amino acid transporter